MQKKNQPAVFSCACARCVRKLPFLILSSAHGLISRCGRYVLYTGHSRDFLLFPLYVPREFRSVILCTDLFIDSLGAT